MRTVAETSVFIRYAAEVWSDSERQAFIGFIAQLKKVIEHAV